MADFHLSLFPNSPRFLSPSPAGLMTVFCSLRFEPHPTWRARSPYLHPPRTGWPDYTPRHWVPSRRRATVRLHTNPHTGRTEFFSCIVSYSLVAGETTRPRRRSLATAVILSPVYTAVTRQWVYMSQYCYRNKHLVSMM
jgi:hypothetical protein